MSIDVWMAVSTVGSLDEPNQSTPEHRTADTSEHTTSAT
jgi:hypothetical protein